MKTLSSIRLTDNQKRVMARILAAPTPAVAASEISNNQNMIGATQTLVRLGLIHYNNDDAAITDQGLQIMKNEALVDETGQLTPDGEELAHTDISGKPTQSQAAPPPETSDVTGDMMGGAPAGPPGGAPQPGLQLQHDDYFDRMLLLKELINS